MDVFFRLVDEHPFSHSVFREWCFFCIPFFFQKTCFKHQRTSIQHYEAQPNVLQLALVCFFPLALLVPRVLCAYLSLGQLELAKRELCPSSFISQKILPQFDQQLFRLFHFTAFFPKKGVENLRQMKMLFDSIVVSGPNSDLEAS